MNASQLNTLIGGASSVILLILKRGAPLFSAFVLAILAAYLFLRPAKASAPPENIPAGQTPHKGITITDRYHQKDFESSDLMREIIAHYINPSSIPAMEAQLLLDAPVLVDSTATTRIFHYEVTLHLTVYQADGIHVCEERQFSTTVRAGDGATPDGIKQEAVVEFSRKLAAQLDTPVDCRPDRW